MLKKIFSSFLIIFLLNTSYIPFIPQRYITRRKKIEYIYNKVRNVIGKFIFLKDKTIVLIYSNIIPMKIKESILNKN
ncbi:MAG: hypothetical protein ABIM49_05910 [candidate division WOR-3 bacterium]